METSDLDKEQGSRIDKEFRGLDIEESGSSISDLEYSLNYIARSIGEVLHYLGNYEDKESDAGNTQCSISVNNREVGPRYGININNSFRNLMRGDRAPYEVMRGDREPYEVMGGDRVPYEVMRGDEDSSEIIEGAEKSFSVIGYAHTKIKNVIQSLFKISTVSPEQGVSHRSPEQGVSHRSPEQGVSHRSPEQGVSHRSPEQGVSHRSPEQGVSHRSPEQGVSHRSPEQGISHRSPEQGISHRSPEQDDIICDLLVRYVKSASIESAVVPLEVIKDRDNFRKDENFNDVNSL